MNCQWKLRNEYLVSSGTDAVEFFPTVIWSSPDCIQANWFWAVMVGTSVGLNMINKISDKFLCLKEMYLRWCFSENQLVLCLDFVNCVHLHLSDPICLNSLNAFQYLLDMDVSNLLVAMSMERLSHSKR